VQHLCFYASIILFLTSNITNCTTTLLSPISFSFSFSALYLRLRAAFDKENVKNVHQPSFFTSPVKSSPSPSPSGGIRTYPGTFDGNPSFQEAYRINSEFAQMMINGQLDQLQRSDGGRLLLSLPPPPPKRRLSALTGSWRTPEYVGG